MKAEDNSKTPTKHFQFYLETIIFRVDDTLFRVPSQYFHEKSTVFGGASNISKEGCRSEEEIVNLSPLPHGAGASDFEYLVRIIMAFTYELPTPNCYNLRQWLSVLKLATAWEFAQIRSLALNHMRAMQNDAIQYSEWSSILEFSWNLPSFFELREIAVSCLSAERFRLSPTSQVWMGQKYMVREWVTEGLKRLGGQENLPHLDELKENLGIDMTIALLYFRDSLSSQSLKSACLRCRRLSSSKELETSQVEEHFSGELSRYDYPSEIPPAPSCP
ncbi:hypothetical protein AAF712_007304 [Marasmius tenuissimus]|uniref:BTB domain-containing protein n=1 Tax=Marasmius tenuissimus TaxID=585030 RepID=A0ABR2ZW80_9AGAR|nr:hypothetical protein PM082_013877 [Marasmius tenuissimus]